MEPVADYEGGLIATRPVPNQQWLLIVALPIVEN